MKNIIALYISVVLLACLSSVIICGPIDSTHDELIEQINKVEFMEKSDGLFKSNVRMPRFTCDIFSAEFEGISIANGLCFAKCLGQRHLGGQCKDGICKCTDREF
ncbi:hypothetical protein PV327_000462 [Microctonus hyperodae]|uniref:Uncharacterized protein n=1 Tax=Microctonus hyperodae TaxID=165561 RepID=A0AA39G684_MICHY|nr:hypothetical protein PV327_000462 [Microctonus hyperodae]